MTLFSYCEHCGARSDQAHYSNCTANEPPATPDNGWRPIETAPKDGTEVLLWGIDHGMIVLYFDDDDGDPKWPWKDAACGIGYFEGAFSHWRYLPQPPEATPQSVACVPSTNQEP